MSPAGIKRSTRAKHCLLKSVRADRGTFMGLRCLLSFQHMHLHRVSSALNFHIEYLQYKKKHVYSVGRTVGVRVCCGGDAAANDALGSLHHPQWSPLLCHRALNNNNNTEEISLVLVLVSLVNMRHSWTSSLRPTSNRNRIKYRQ